MIVISIDDHLNKEEFKWVKEDLIPLINLLNSVRQHQGNGYFQLPLSKENLIENLTRIRNKSRELIIEELNSFFEEFKDYIRISNTTEINCKYETPSSSSWHHWNLCTDKISQEFYILNNQLEEKFLKMEQKEEFHSNEIFNQIKRRVSQKGLIEVENLLFLGIIKLICRKSKFGVFFDFFKDGAYEITKFLQKANIDDELIDYLLSDSENEIIWHTLGGGDSPFKLLFKRYRIIDLPNNWDAYYFYEKLPLPKNHKWYAVFYSHNFNLTSCYIINNIILKGKIAEELFKELNKISIEKILVESYKKIKEKYVKDYKDFLPLFEYNNNLLTFLNKYYDKLKISERTPFFEMILTNDEKKILEELQHEELIKVDENRIIANSEQFSHLHNLRNDYKRIEDERIGRNITGLFFAWIRSETSIIFKEKIIIPDLEPIIPSESIKDPELDPNIITDIDILSKKGNIIIGSEKIPEQWGVIGRSDDKLVLIDLNAPHIVFVSGMMGAGKGYTIGAITEMLVSNSIPNISNVKKKATVIVLYKPRDDVASEFWSIGHANDNSKEIKALSKYNTREARLLEDNQIKIFLEPTAFSKYKETFQEEYNTSNVEPLYIDPSTLLAEDWNNALSIGGSSTALYTSVIYKILNKLPVNYNLDDLKREIKNSDLNQNQQKLAEIRLSFLEDYFKNDDILNNLVIGGVNIIDYRKCMSKPDDILTVMTLIISKLQNKKEFEYEPFVFVMNEAHMYFKKGISNEFVDTIENLIRRRRHGANWLLLDTHFLSDVDPKIFNLSDIKIIHFTDKSVKSSILDRLLEETAPQLYKLNIGECIIFCNESSIGKSKSIKVNIRPRITKHGGSTKTAI